MRCRSAASVVLGFAVLVCGRGEAQQDLFSRAVFVLPPAEVDYARYYTTPEHCFAAFERVRDSAIWGTSHTVFDPTRWQEVLAAEDLRHPAPPAAVATGRRCGDRFRKVEAVAAADLPLLQEFFLQVAEDSVAEAVFARRVALLPRDSARQGHLALLEDALAFARDERRPQPVPLAWMQRRVADALRLGLTPDMRVGLYTGLLGYAAAVYDTVQFDRYARIILALADSISPNRRRGLAYIAGRLHRMRALTRGEPVAPLSAEPVPALVGDFWFRRADSMTSRPTRGKPSLVLFVEPQCLGNCYEAAALKELDRRFGGALEITLVTHTHGYFRNYPPPEPADEAELLRSYFFEYLQLPGALLVENTSFTRLPVPDGRRVDQAPPNVVTYQVGNGTYSARFGIHRDDGYHFLLTTSGVLVGPDGRIVIQIHDLADSGGFRLLTEAIAGYLAGSATKS